MRPTETNHWNLWGTLGKICPWQNLQTDHLTVICDTSGRILRYTSQRRGYRGGSAGGGLCLVKAQSRTGSWFSFVSKQHIYASPLEFGRADFGGPEVLNRVCLTLFKATPP